MSSPRSPIPNALPQGATPIIVPPRLQKQQQQEELARHKHQQHHRGLSSNSHIRSASNDNTTPTRLRPPVEGSSLLINRSNRLRSESNPLNSSSSHRYNNSGAPPAEATTAATSGSSQRSPLTSPNDVPPNRFRARSNTTGSPLQERPKEPDRMRDRREYEDTPRAAREDPKSTLPLLTGTSLRKRFQFAKEAINTTISGEERWPGSDDSDFEGESHVSRVLREYTYKKESNNKLLAPETPLSPISPLTPTTPRTPVIPERSESIVKHQELREAIRKNIRVVTNPNVLSRSATGSSNHMSPVTPSPTTPGGGMMEYQGLLLKSRDRSGHQPSRSVDGIRDGRSHDHNKAHGDAVAPVPGAGPTLAVPTMINGRPANRFRTSSDASLNEALGRLEGKRNQDALLAQVSHLGSTRARSPHRGQRAYRDHIDVVPPPPLPTPKSEFRQQMSPPPALSLAPKVLGASRRPRQRQLEQPSQYI